MKRYNPKDIEPKWQKEWADKNMYEAVDFDETRPKYVMLTEFPYPSGDGLHLGHVREYTYGDIISRHKRMNGYNVLYPMGWDSFGLPTENYAIKMKISPQKVTEKNTATFHKQMADLGLSFDWSRSFDTTDPKYYKWTQWLFLQFYKKGLAYQDEVDINWCPHCKTGLANEEVVNGRHERCDTLVEKKTLKQWLLRITDYADRLIDGLQTVDYPSRIADQQINWIGRSTGAEVDFALEGSKEKITVFTTRPDTLFGASFLVLAPEHDLVEQITTDEHRAAVNSYIKAAQAKSEIERQDASREKTGAFTGAYATNPVNGERVPIWIADYVLAGYGTGAIMAVPAHDERDHEFAKKYELPIRQVISPYIIASGINKARDEVETLERDVVDAIIKNDKDEYLLIVEDDNIHFVGGGIEPEDADEVAAIKREVVEESGYTDYGSITLATSEIRVWGYRIPKNKNQLVRGRFYEVVLASDNQVKSEVDEGRHKLRWVKKDEVAGLLTWEAHALAWEQYLKNSTCFTGDGLMINSGGYDGLPSAEAREKIVADLAKKGMGKEKVQYKLRDWVFSRQHYWGEPIPIVHCKKDGVVPVPEDKLPVTLPKVENYEPTDTGESPLAAITDWVNTTCPKCGGPAQRETDTMPNWAGSSWYYLRYYDAHNNKAFADRKKLDYWGEVDLYLGGMEHTTLHLLYSRFWHQFFYDQGLVPTPEPYHARRGQGIILAADGTKMSKSKGNVVNPTSVIDAGYGADALRLAIVFLAPYDQTTPWSPEGVAGTHRFLNRVWTLTQDYLAAKPGDSEDKAILAGTHRTIKKVSQDLQHMNYNTAVSALMEFTNELYKIKAEKGFVAGKSWQFALNSLLQLLAPFAPHITEELWHQLGNEDSIHTSEWPAWDEQYLVTDTITVVVQVNGKVRAQLQVAADATEEDVITAAKADQKVAGYLEGATMRKTIYVPGKLISFVVS